MWISNLLGGAMMLFFGFIVRFMKASGLIAGYNTMSKEEKAKYDEEKLTRFVGDLLLINGAILLVPVIISLLIDVPPSFIGISWILFVVVIISGVIYMNTGNRFKK